MVIWGKLQEQSITEVMSSCNTKEEIIVKHKYPRTHLGTIESEEEAMKA